MGKKSSAPTMKDVAAEAGVALATVSKVVNGLPVGADYEKRVKKAIQKLGYKVNTYAQALRADKTNTIAFLVPNTDNPYFGWLTYHINRILTKKNHRMLLCCTDAVEEHELAFLEMVQQHRVDGIIILTYNDHIPPLDGIACVTIDRHLSPNIPCVASDNFEGGQLAAQTLVDLGCRKLAFIGNKVSMPTEVSKRSDGFRSTCDALGIEYRIITVEAGIPPSDYEVILKQHIKNGKFEYDGLFCNTDHLARLTIHLLRAEKIHIPEDVQIIGFDGLRNYATGNYICSTIVQPVEQIAHVTVDTILRDDPGPAPSLICLPVKYAYGGTTKRK